MVVKPRPINSGAASVTRKAISCTVNVVPMSAPRITPSVWRNVMRPAATKPISMSVVAADDWMIAVIAAPETTARIRLRDSPVKRLRRRPPSARWSASPLRRIP